MTHQGYGFFCPTAKACEVLEPRWTMLILSEMSCGSTRFNDIRRGVPGISPTLLSKRLKEMEAAGLVERVEDHAAGTIDYLQTRSAEELEPIIEALGRWAHKHIDTELTLEHLDARTLLWNIRRKIDLRSIADRRTVVRFHFPDAEKASDRLFWLIWKPGVPVDVCFDDPGFDVDLFIEAELKAFTSYWLGYSSLAEECERDRIVLLGNQLLVKTVDRWLVRSAFAHAA